MLNDTFYPTPTKVAKQMIAKLKGEAQYILEPSAGSGAILDTIVDHFGMRSYKDSPIVEHYHRLYAVEVDQELCAILQQKDYRVVAFDFLKYNPSNFFDTVLMNPPFNKGAEHLLHAVEILNSGEIVCLLNRETIDNPFSTNRSILLNRLKELNAEIEYIGQVFTDAERKTMVDTVMVYIRIVGKPIDGFEYWSTISEEVSKTDTPEVGNELTSSSQIEATVASFNAVKNEMYEGFKHIQRAIYYSAGTIDPLSTSTEDALNDLKNIKDPQSSFYLAFNRFMDQYRKDSWKDVFRRTGADDLMSRKVRDRFTTDLEKGSNIDFTIENIQSIIENLFVDRLKIIRESITDIFDHLCSFDVKNKVYLVEGWKTNSAYKVNQKMIIPYMVEYNGYSPWSVRYGYRSNEVLNDLDRILCYLSGKKWVMNSTDKEEIPTRTILKTLDNRFSDLNNQYHGRITEDESQTGESEFFNIRFYKKGTLHLMWKDAKLWERFNKEAAKGKRWIGEDNKNE